MDTFFYAEITLHALRASTFTQRHFDTQWQARLHANTLHGNVYFAHVFFLRIYTRALSQGCFQSHMLLHRDVFTQRRLYTEILLHRDAFTHRNVFLHILLQRDDFTWAILHTDAKTSRSAFTKECISTRSFYLWAFLHTTEWFPTVDMHMAQKNSANICKITLSPQLLTFETHIVGQGWPSASPHCNLTSMYDDRHFAQEGCVSWTSIHAALVL